MTWQDVLDRSKPDWKIIPFDKANLQEVPPVYMRAVPKKLIHQAALALYDCGAPRGSVSAVVELAWTESSPLFMALAGDQAFDILRYCRFDLPSELGSSFAVWRGVRGVSLDVARAGHSWTTDRSMAATWAMHLGNQLGVRGAPLVVRRVVQATDVVLYTDLQDMGEVVIDAPPDGDVDGCPDEWNTTARDYLAQLRWQEATQRVMERMG